MTISEDFKTNKYPSAKWQIFEVQLSFCLFLEDVIQLIFFSGALAPIV